MTATNTCGERVPLMLKKGSVLGVVSSWLKDSRLRSLRCFQTTSGKGSAGASAPRPDFIRRYTPTDTPAPTLVLPLVDPLPCRPSWSSGAFVPLQYAAGPPRAASCFFPGNIRRHPVSDIDYMTSLSKRLASCRTVYRAYSLLGIASSPPFRFFQ